MSEIEVIDDGNHNEILVLEQQRDPIVRAANAVLVHDDATYKIAAEILTTQIKPMQKAIVKGCDPVRASTTKAWQAALDLEKKLLSPLKQAETLIKTKMSDHQEEVAQQRQDQVEFLPSSVIPSAPGTSTRKTWHAEVVDLQALIAAVAKGEAPATLLKVDEARLKKVVNSLDGEVDYPGVRIWQQIGIAAKAVTS